MSQGVEGSNIRIDTLREVELYFDSHVKVASQ